jgi:trk system potassium uptake protein TrkA
MMASKKPSFAVLGLSKFGYRVAVGLYRADADVIAIDRDERLVHRIADQVTRAVQADAIDQGALEHLGVFDVDVVVIGFRSSFDAAVLLTMMLRKRRADIQIIAQVDTDEKAEALRQVGGDITVFPARDIADRVVKRLVTSDLIEHIEVAPDVAVIEIPVPSSFVGKSLFDLDIRVKYELHVVGVMHPGGRDGKDDIVVVPPANTIFREGEVLLLLGRIENLNRFSAICRDEPSRLSTD